MVRGVLVNRGADPPGHPRHMIRFAEVFPDPAIVSALGRELSWTHFRRIISLDDPLKREFYAEMCRIERWSTRTLEEKIAGMLYERTALSRKPAALARREPKSLRYCYKPQPLRPLEEIRADILALTRETEGLLGEILGIAKPRA